MCENDIIELLREAGGEASASISSSPLDSLEDQSESLSVSSIFFPVKADSFPASNIYEAFRPVEVGPNEVGL